MGNLLRADFFRLWRSKCFWACMIFQVGTLPAGVTFCRQKVTKDRQRRGLPPPCGIHPAVLAVPASFSFQPLDWFMSHR